MNLSNSAKRSLKVSGGYQCKAPSVPYRFVCCDPEALMSYNKDYMRGFVRALNEGNKVWRTEDGVVTTAAMTWAHAERHTNTDNDSDFDNVADVYMHFAKGDRWVGYLVKNDSLTAARHAVDFTDECSDALGFWHPREE